MDDGLDPEDDGVGIRTRTEGDATVVTVTGEVDSQTIPRLTAVVTEVVARPGVSCVVLDLNSVVFFGSAGIAFLTQAASEARARDVDLRLVADTDSRVHRVLEMMGLTRLLAVFPTDEGALQGR